MWTLNNLNFDGEVCGNDQNLRKIMSFAKLLFQVEAGSSLELRFKVII